jgi:hypothetical protein
MLPSLPDVNELKSLGDWIKDIKSVWYIAFIEFEWDWRTRVPDVVVDLLFAVEMASEDVFELTCAEIDRFPILHEKASVKYGTIDANVRQ